MVLLEKIREEIKHLSYNDFMKLKEWIVEQDCNDWDKQIEEDNS